MVNTECEILILVEGIDTYTSSTMQARHSYSFTHGDILFNQTYVPCVVKDSKNGKCIVDLQKFQQTKACDQSMNQYLSVPSIV